MEVEVEDDLSPESGSESMEIDEPAPQGVQRGPANISGVLLPDTMAKFNVRLLLVCVCVCVL